MDKNKMEIINVNGQDVYIRIDDEIDYIVDNETIELVLEWVKKYIRPYEQVHINYSHSSYGLKHIVEENLGIYVNNGVLKIAMAKLGFGISHRDSYLNPSYNIDEKFFRAFPDPKVKKKSRRKARSKYSR